MFFAKKIKKMKMQKIEKLLQQLEKNKTLWLVDCLSLIKASYQEKDNAQHIIVWRERLLQQRDVIFPILEQAKILFPLYSKEDIKAIRWFYHENGKRLLLRKRFFLSSHARLFWYQIKKKRLHVYYLYWLICDNK